MIADVVVIGAGIAGLTAGRRLSDAGRTVTVLDKGRGVGGRLATRRVGGARFDHGAQFFTVRSDRFGQQVEAWLARGVVREWCRGFRSPPDGHPRYVGATGMTAPAKDLADGLDVRVATHVDAVVQTGDTGSDRAGWCLQTQSGASFNARAVLATAPVPQTLGMLGAGGTRLDALALAALEAVSYDPTLAALVMPAGQPAVPAPGGVQLDEGMLSWVADNLAKGVSPAPALTVHASGSSSATRWDEQPEAVLAEMLAAGATWIGPLGASEAQLVRWRYAQPTVLHPDRYLMAVDGPAPLACAGDAFGEARVEGAALSGWAAAGALLDRLA